MAKQSGKGDIGSQLDRLGQLLDELPEGRREAFFKWIEEADPTPPGGKSPPQVVRPEAAPSHGAIRLAGKRRSTSIAISEPLLERLKEYSLDQGIRLSISALIELLVWQFLGSPSDLLERLPQAYRPRAAKDPEDDFMTALTMKSVNTILGELDNDTSKD